jgi:hypothetical protein
VLDGGKFSPLKKSNQPHMRVLQAGYETSELAATKVFKHLNKSPGRNTEGVPSGNLLKKALKENKAILTNKQ